MPAGVGPAGPAAILVDLPISLALSAATACSWAEQAFAAGGDNGNESFESRFLCNGTTLCYTIDLWRTDIQVLVYIIENRGAKWLMVLTGAECDKVKRFFEDVRRTYTAAL